MASADFSVVTPERVSLEYGIAGIGSRGAAAMVDTALQAVALTVVITAGFAAVAAIGAMGSAISTLLVLGLFALASFAITAGYFMIFEIVWNGQTPGKRLLGIRVIRESGYPIRPVDAVIRNLVRVLDWLPFFYAIGVLVMLFNARSKRLGDFACGTIVVREGSGSPISPFRAPVVEQRYTLSSADATLVRDFLVRRQSMDPKARAELAQRLAAALVQRYHLSLDSASDSEHFLEGLSA